MGKNEAVRADDGKVRYSLMPRVALEGISRVLMFGGRKYADHNWARGFKWSRIYDSCQRHLNAWWAGEDLDPESGLSHLFHAGCNIMFLIAHEAYRLGTDDRYKWDASNVDPPVGSEEWIAAKNAFDEARRAYVPPKTDFVDAMRYGVDEVEDDGYTTEHPPRPDALR